MFRLLFRLLAMIALAIAVIMAVLDATRSIAASAFVVTPLSTSWMAVSPDTLSVAEAFVRDKVGAFAWDPVLALVLGLPGFVVFSALAFLLYAVGRRPEPPAGRLLA